MQASASISTMRNDGIGILIDGFIDAEPRTISASLARENAARESSRTVLDWQSQTVRLVVDASHNLRFVSLNGMMRLIAPLASRMRISPERKQART
jgi:hypothetical protein